MPEDRQCICDALCLEEIEHVGCNATPVQDDGGPQELIGLCFRGLPGIGVLDSGGLASSLRQQKQIELKHLADLALGIVKEGHAAARKGDIAVADAQKRAA